MRVSKKRCALLIRFIYFRQEASHRIPGFAEPIPADSRLSCQGGPEAEAHGPRGCALARLATRSSHLFDRGGTARLLHRRKPSMTLRLKFSMPLPNYYSLPQDALSLSKASYCKEKGSGDGPCA